MRLQDLVAYHRVIHAYSPDQPRDSHGRWGAGDYDAATVSPEHDQDRIRKVLERADSDPAVANAEYSNIQMGDHRIAAGVLDANGHYTAAADAENWKIAASFLDPAAKNSPGTQPSAVFMIGKPGAGKSTTIVTLGDSFPKSVMINSDDIKARIPGFSPELSGAYHERSCDIARNYLTPAAISAHMNVCFDMTNNVDRLLQTIKSLKTAGYSVGVIHAHVSDATSAERVLSRFHENGRYVAPRTALSYSGRPKLAYEASKQYADQWKEYDTSGSSHQPKETDSGGSGVFK